MLDFQVQRFSRRCTRTDRELRPGEVYYSVLVAEGADVVRYDFCEAAWEGPPPGALGFWRARVPDAHGHQFHFAPHDVMLQYFARLADDPTKVDVCYIVALLLLRRRVVRLEETERVGDREFMVLVSPRTDQEYRIATVDVSPRRAQEIQEELAALLFADAS
jgi:hypothetical protein